MRRLPGAISETRKLAAILVTDVVRSGRLAGTEEDRNLVRLRALCGDLIEPAIAVRLKPGCFSEKTPSLFSPPW
jgi:class 3 adenylate cyclase